MHEPCRVSNVKPEENKVKPQTSRDRPVLRRGPFGPLQGPYPQGFPRARESGKGKDRGSWGDNMWLLQTNSAENCDKVIHLSRGETTVVVGKEAFDEAAQQLSLLLPDIPCSLIVKFLVDDNDGSVKVLNLSNTMCVWVQGEPLPCHGVATLREGNDVCIHSLRYAFRVSTTSSFFSAPSANSFSSLIPDHALEVGEIKTWFAFFGLIAPTTATTLTEDGRLLTAVSYEMESMHRQGHFLSFETIIEKSTQETCLTELCSITEIAAGAIAFLQRCAASQSDSGGELADAMTTMFQQESYLAQGKRKRLSLARILALSLRSMPEQIVSSQLLLQELILPLYPEASRYKTEEIAQSLAQLLAVDGEETETVVQVLLLMLMRRLFPPAGGVPRSRGPAEELPGLIDDVKDVLAWLRQRDASAVEEKLGHAAKLQQQSPASVMDLSPAALPSSSSSPKPLSRLHLPQPEPPLSLAAQLHVNRHVLHIIFSIYNAMQRGRERTQSPSTPKRVFLLNQEMSLATLRLLMRDFGLEPFFSLENLRAIIACVKKVRVGGGNSGSPMKLSPARRLVVREKQEFVSAQSRPSFWSPTRSSAAKLAQRSPSSPRSSPPVLSWGPSVNFEEFQKVLLNLGEIEAIANRPGGLIGIVNASKAAKRLGLRSADLFSVRAQPVPRLRSPSRSMRPASTPTNNSPTSSSSSPSTRRLSMSQSLSEIRRALF